MCYNLCKLHKTAGIADRLQELNIVSVLQQASASGEVPSVCYDI